MSVPISCVRTAWMSVCVASSGEENFTCGRGVDSAIAPLLTINAANTQNPDAIKRAKPPAPLPIQCLIALFVAHMSVHPFSAVVHRRRGARRQVPVRNARRQVLVPDARRQVLVRGAPG